MTNSFQVVRVLEGFTTCTYDVLLRFGHTFYVTEMTHSQHEPHFLPQVLPCWRHEKHVSLKSNIRVTDIPKSQILVSIYNQPFSTCMPL